MHYPTDGYRLGEIKIDGNEINSLSRAKCVLGATEIQMVFQDPFASLNPRVRVGISLPGSSYTRH